MKTWQKMMFLVVPFTLVFSVILTQQKSHGADLLDEGRLNIEISVSPGKPGAPTESISVRRRDGQFTVTVARIPQSGEPESESFQIAEAEFNEIKSNVAKGGLLRWLPSGKVPSGADFAEHRFRIEWQPSHISRPNVHSVGWTSELTSKDKAMKTLQARLIKMAVPNLKKVKLYYFPTSR